MRHIGTPQHNRQDDVSQAAADREDTLTELLSVPQENTDTLSDSNGVLTTCETLPNRSCGVRDRTIERGGDTIAGFAVAHEKIFDHSGYGTSPETAGEKADLRIRAVDGSYDRSQHSTTGEGKRSAVLPCCWTSKRQHSEPCVNEAHTAQCL